jgi:hypothetical protein
VDASLERYGLPRGQVHYLTEKPESDPKRATGRSTRDEVAGMFGKLAAAGPEDTVFVVRSATARSTARWRSSTCRGRI